MKHVSIEDKPGFPWGLLWIFLFFLVALTAIAGMLYMKQRERIIQKQREKLAAVSQLQSTRIQTWHQNYRSVIRLIQSSSMIREDLSRATTDRKRIQAIDEQVRAVMEIYRIQELHFLDPVTLEHLLTEQIHTDSPPMTAAEREQLIRSPHMITAVWHDNPDEGPHLDFISAIQDEDRVIAFIALTVDPFEDLFPLLQQWPTPTMTAESLLISRMDDAVIFLNELRHRKNTAMKLTVPLNRHALPAAMAVSGVVGPVEGMDYRDVPVFAHVTSVPDTGWFLVTKIDKQETLEPTIHWFWLMSALTATLIILAAVLILLHWRHQRAVYYRKSLAAKTAHDEQQRRWSTLLKNLPGMAYRCLNDTQWTMVMTSHGTLKLTGYQPDELMGNSSVSYADLILPADRSKVWDTVQAAVARRADYQMEYRIRTKEGNVRWVWEQGIGIFSPTGKLEALEGFITDVTDRRRATEYQALVHEIYEAADSTTGIPAFLGKLVDLLQPMLDARHFVVTVYDSETHSFQALASRGDMESVQSYPAKDTLSEYVRRKGTPQLLDSDRMKQLIKEGQIKAFGLPSEQWMGIPLTAGGSVFGLMILQSYDNREAYNTQHLALMSDLSNQLSAVISRKLAEESLRISESKYRELANRLTVGLYRTKPDGSLVFHNDVLARILGETEAENLDNSNVNSFYLDESDRERHLDLLAESPDDAVDEFQLKRKDGTVIWVRNRNHTIRDENGEAIFYEGILEDITEQKQLEERLTKAERMESIGQLAGGVAHDFNNLLTPILGYTELLLAKLPPEWPQREQLEAIRQAAESSKKLVQQLLAYGRKQILRMQEVDVVALLREMEPLLRRTIPASIEIDITTAPEPIPVRADPSQLEQVMLNMSVNARDAMPGGGKLQIDCRRLPIVSEENEFDLQPGTYAHLIISDTGTGMDVQTLSKVFEPFFTTKERGRGTGLGLAMVYGIIRQHQGEIRGTSNPGAGSRFDIFLPALKTETSPSISRKTPSLMQSEGESVLLVEDSDEVRMLTTSILSEMGYRVSEAATPQQALETIRSGEVVPDILLSDVVMPGMNGPELYQQILDLLPDLPAVFMSGYSEDVLQGNTITGQCVRYVQKPFKAATLSVAVREALNSRQGPDRT